MKVHVKRMILLLHHDMAASSPHFTEAVTGKYGAYLRGGLGSLCSKRIMDHVELGEILKGKEVVIR
jgi:hypothetical protein